MTRLKIHILKKRLHFERAMERVRFIEFRRYFNQEMLTFIDGESKIEELHHNMVLSYPELHENCKLPELYLREC